MWHKIQSVTFVTKCHISSHFVWLVWCHTMTKCDTRYKVWHLSQSVTFVTKCHIFLHFVWLAWCHTFCHKIQSVTFVTKCHIFPHLVRFDVTLYVHLSLVFSWADQRSVMLAILSTSSMLGQFSVHPIGVLGLVLEQQEILMPL